MIVVRGPAWAHQVRFPRDTGKGCLTSSWIEVILSQRFLCLHLHQYRLLDVELVLVPANVQLRWFIVIRVVIVIEKCLTARDRVAREKVDLR